MNSRSCFLIGLSLVLLLLTLPWSLGPERLWGLPLWAVTSMIASGAYALTVALLLRPLLGDDPPRSQRASGDGPCSPDSRDGAP